MLRTRLVWFGLGFATSGAAVSQLVYRDLLVDQHEFVSEMNGKFDELEARVRNIEAVPSSHGSPAEAKGHRAMAGT